MDSSARRRRSAELWEALRVGNTAESRMIREIISLYADEARNSWARLDGNALYRAQGEMMFIERMQRDMDRKPLKQDQGA